MTENKSSKMGEFPYLDNNGYLWVSARVTRLGVMPYNTSECDSANTNQEIHQELKCEEELFKKDTLNSWYGIPITLEHPMEGEVTPATHRILSIGKTMSNLERDGQFLKSRLQITEPSIIDDIMTKNQNGGSVEVSCGYYADIDWERGVWNGIEYDAVQRNIMFNHLALVSEGRAGPEVKLII